MPRPKPLVLALLLAGAFRSGDVAWSAAEGSAGPDSCWLSDFHAPGMDGRVQAFCAYRGDLVAGGTFQTVGAQLIRHIARWDGAAWHPLGSGVGGAVSRLLVFRGDLVAIGDFADAGGEPASRIARWDGSAWYPLGEGLDDLAEDLAVFRDTLFVGGRFSRAGPVAVKGIARWDGAGWHDGIAMVGPEQPAWVAGLAAFGDRLVAICAFPPEEPDQGPLSWRSRPVLWTGAGWVPLPDGSGEEASPTMEPRHLAVYRDSLYVTGDFAGMDQDSLHREGIFVARWTGQGWHLVGREWWDDPGIAVEHGGELHLGRAGALYRWTGQEWSLVSNPDYAELDVLHSWTGALYSGGRLVEDGEQVAHGLARWDGAAWSAVGSQGGNGLGFWDGDRQVVLAPAGDGFNAGGTFRQAGNLEVQNLVRWGGLYWMPLLPGPSPFRANAFVDLQGRLATTQDGFPGAGCWIRTLEGSYWKDLAWFPELVFSLLPWRNRLVVGGAFGPGHVVLAPQAITNPDLVLEPLGPGLNGDVQALCRFRGSVVASGDFTATADGELPLQRVGLWDGSAWQPLGGGLPAPARALEVYAGGVAAGTGDGVWHWDGAAWSRMGGLFDGPVDALAVFEGELLAGGSFTHAGETRLAGLARWRDGEWQQVGTGMNGAVQDLLVNGPELWAGGSFTAAGSVPSSGVAGWRELRASVESFYTHVREDSVSVSWRDPESTTHESTVVRWSRFDFPADPQDGDPFPFGDQGRFPASSGTVRAFRQAVPFDGGEAYYSAFALHAGGRCSAPRRARVAMPDRVPPAIDLELSWRWEDRPRLALLVRCGGPDDSVTVAARLDSTPIPLAPTGQAGTDWAGAVEISPCDSCRLHACGRDSLGNEACAERGIAAAAVRPLVAGRCAATEEGLLVEWPATAFASEGLVAVIEHPGAESTTFELAAHESPLALCALSFRIRPGDPGSDDPLRIGVLGPDGSVQGGVFDAGTGRLVIRTSMLGRYQLVLGDRELTVMARPGYLMLAPAAPNPFREATEIWFELRSRQRVRATVHDVAGRMVAVLWDGMAGPGAEALRWDGRRHAREDLSGIGGTAAPATVGPDRGRALPSGVYFLRVQGERMARTARLVRLR